MNSILRLLFNLWILPAFGKSLITPQINAVSPQGNAFLIEGFLVASGSYATGGDAVDFTAAVADPSFIGLLAALEGSAILQADAWSMNGQQIAGANSVAYDFVCTKTGTPALINPKTGCKLKVSAVGTALTTEHAATAYESQITGDIIAFSIVVTKLL